MPKRGRGNHVGNALPVILPRPDLEIGSQWPGDFLGHELLERLARDAPDQFADQVALVAGVIARSGAGFPPGGLGRQPPRGSIPVVHLLQGKGRIPA